MAPARLIASNAGVEGDVIIEKLMGKPFEMGYNAVRLRLSFPLTACQHTLSQHNLHAPRTCSCQFTKSAAEHTSHAPCLCLGV